MSAASHACAAVIPAIDEAIAIGDLVTGLLRGGACCVFVVDGGSADGTPAIARAAGARVIEEPRRGYGQACLTGAAAAIPEHSMVAFLDGDGSCDPADLAGLIEGLREADVVLGRRTPDRIEVGALPWHARWGNVLVATVIRIRTGRTVHDLPPYKVLRTHALVTLGLDDPGFGWTVQLVVRSLMARSLRVVERPVAFRLRRGGVSKVSGSWRTSIAAGRRMLERAISESKPRPIVALMAKAPVAGHAKTRLAAGIGADAALELWRACLADLGSGLRAEPGSGRWSTVAIVSNAEEIAPVAALLGPGWEVMSQTRIGLGGAIVDGMVEAMLRRAPCAVAVSGDNPTLPRDLLVGALRQLDRSASVLGPCPDGGYYLVGVRLPRSSPWDRVRVRRRWRVAAILDGVFGAVRLGGATALDTTRSGLHAAGLDPVLLASWADIDTAADLPALVRSCSERPPTVAPATRAWLVTHRQLIESAPELAGATQPRAVRPSAPPVARSTSGSAHRTR